MSQAWLVLFLSVVISTLAQAKEPHPKNLPAVQNNEGIVLHPSVPNEVMMGSPVSEENLVTRENWDSTPEKLRWAMQHWRELFPTQAVSRGLSPIVVLNRSHKPIINMGYEMSNGNSTTFLDAADSMKVDAILVLHQGEVVAEHYFHGMLPHTPHALTSVNKSIVSTVVFSLVSDGSLNLQTTIESYVPELAQSPYKGATLRQILDMKSAVKSVFEQHEKAISPTVADDAGVPAGEQNLLLTLPGIPTEQHGNSMYYKESDPAVLVWAAERVTGKRFADIASERLWSKIGAEFDLEVGCDTRCHWTHRTSMCLRDMGRWGQMLANGGEFNGHQVVAKRFIDDIRRNADVANLEEFVDRLSKELETKVDLLPEGFGYRSFFWIDVAAGRAFGAGGAFGQILYVNPDHDAVVVMLASDPDWMSNNRERWHFCRELSKAVSR